MALVVIPAELVAELPVAAVQVITAMVLKVLVKLQAVPMAEPLEKEDPELLLMVATAEAVAAAGTVVAELIRTAVEMMIVVVEEVQVLLGTLKLNNMYQLVTQSAKIIL